MKVPIETPQLSLGVPGVNAPPSYSYGKVGQAVAEVGAGVEAQATNVLGQIAHAQAQDESGQAYYQDKLEATERIRQLKLNSPDGFMRDPDGSITRNNDGPNNQPGSYKTITQAFHEWANERYQQRQQDFSTAAAAEMYKPRMMQEFSDQTALLDNDAQLMKVKAWDENKQGQILRAGDALITAPTVQSAYDYSNNFTKDFHDQVGIIHNGADAQQKTMVMNQVLAKKLLEGGYAQALGDRKQNGPLHIQDIQKWLDVIDGKDPASKQRAATGQPTISDMFEPGQKAVEVEKLKRLMGMANTLDQSDLNREAHEYATRAEQGVKNPPALGHILGQVKIAVDNGNKTQGEAAEMVGHVVGATAIGTFQGSAFNLSSLASQKAIVQKGSAYAMQQARENGPKDYPNEFGAVAEKYVNDHGEAYYTDIEKQKQSDWSSVAMENTDSGKLLKQADFSNPAGLATKGNPKAVQDFLASSWGHYQDNYGQDPRYWRPIDKTNSGLMGKALLDPSRSVPQKTADIKAMKQAYGSAFPNLIDTMIKDGSLNESWRPVGTAANNTAMDALISSASSSSVTRKLFEGLGDEKPEEAMARISKLTTGYVGMKLQAAPLNVDQKEFANGINTGVLNAYYDIRRLNPDMDKDTAAQNAYRQVIGNSTSVESVGNHLSIFGYNIKNQGRQFPLEFPPNVQDTDKQRIKDNILAATTEQGLSKLNVVIPDEKGQPTMQADKFIPMVAQTRRLSLVNGPQGPGYTIYYQGFVNGQRDGKDRQLFVKDAQGREKPSFLPMSDVMRFNGQFAAPQPSPAVKKFNPAEVK